jgi:FkbM family methyltransferase
MIDGGANIGFAALYFLNRYPGLHVVAVEPDPATIDLCRKNLAPYGDRTTILEGALWNYPGRICLQSNHEEFATSVRDAGEGEDGSIEAFTVPGVIASHLRDLPVDLLKLDVEGGEKAIFQPGGLEWLARVRNIVIELHGPDCEELFFAALKPYRYRLERRDSVCFCEDLHPVANDRQN